MPTLALSCCSHINHIHKGCRRDTHVVFLVRAHPSAGDVGAKRAIGRTRKRVDTRALTRDGALGKALPLTR